MLAAGACKGKVDTRPCSTAIRNARNAWSTLEQECRLRGSSFEDDARRTVLVHCEVGASAAGRALDDWDADLTSRSGKFRAQEKYVRENVAEAVQAATAAGDELRPLLAEAQTASESALTACAGLEP